MLAIVDASALIAAADTSEPEHARCVEVLSRRDLYLVLPALAVAEAAYVIERRLGPSAEAAFARGLAGFEIDAPLPVDWPIIADLVERYADFPLGTVDASIAVLADRLGTDLIVTLDRRHFGAIRAPSGGSFRLLPEPPTVHETPVAYGEPTA
jgi:predicted nucleic acid-binding protein